MENYVNKIAIVTGASSGIGAALSKELAKRGCIVIGLARRIDKLKALSDEIYKNSEIFKGKFHFLQCDVTSEQQLEQTFVRIESDYGIPWILINNAGTGGPKPFLDYDGETFDNVVNTNAKALFLATKLTVKLMSENSIPGHILNVNSVQGHYLPANLHAVVYSSAKHMARIFAEVIREMMAENKSNIKISNISPGSVRTEIYYDVLWKSAPHLKNSSLADCEFLSVDDVVKACIFILDTPPNVLIPELKIMPIHRSIKHSYREEGSSL